MLSAVAVAVAMREIVHKFSAYQGGGHLVHSRPVFISNKSHARLICINIKQDNTHKLKMM